MMNVGIVSTGKSNPGLNTVITTITSREKRVGNLVHGFQHGWKGVNHGFSDVLSYENTWHLPGSVLSVDDRDPFKFSEAYGHIQHLSCLYCVGEEKSYQSAVKEIELKIPQLRVVGLEVDMTRYGCVGFQTAFQELTHRLSSAKVQAKSTNSVVFFEVPGADLVSSLGSANPLTCDVAIPIGSEECYLFDVQNAYAIEGHCVVVVSEGYDYDYISKHIDRKVVIRPEVRYMHPCLYDSVLASRLAKENLM